MNSIEDDSNKAADREALRTCGNILDDIAYGVTGVHYDWVNELAQKIFPGAPHAGKCFAEAADGAPKEADKPGTAPGPAPSKPPGPR